MRTPPGTPFHGTLLLLRRGPLAPEWDQKVIGQSDPPLAADALARQPMVAEALAAFRPDRVITSDLRRARTTAAAIAEHYGAVLAVRPELREQRFGRWQGRAWAEVLASEPMEALAYFGDGGGGVPPRGESLAKVQARAVHAALVECRRHHRGVICCVGHAGPIRGLLAHALGLTLEQAQRFQLDPFGLTVLEMQGRSATLARLNVPVAGTTPQ